MRKPVIYLAGKITKHDWREQIVFLRDSVGAGDPERDLFDPKFSIDCPDFIYGGPFFVSCDHGCGHGAGMHGTGAGVNATDSVCISAVASHITQRRVFEINRQRIARADRIFTFIDQTDCYGTLIELGLAAQLNKDIAVTFGENLTFKEIRELWMARLCANSGLFIGWRLEDAWDTFLQQPRRLARVV
jgi:hypothetical protein